LGQFVTCLRFGNRTSSIDAKSIDYLLAMAVGPHVNVCQPCFPRLKREIIAFLRNFAELGIE
jgi:hypothetical protein